MPAPHHSSFLQVGCPSCRPINSVKAFSALTMVSTNHLFIYLLIYLFTQVHQFSSKLGPYTHPLSSLFYYPLSLATPHHLPKNPTMVSGQYCQPLINFLKKKTIWGWEVLAGDDFCFGY